MIQRIVRKALWGLFFCFFWEFFCPYLDIRGPGGSEFLWICGTLQCFWKIRRGSYSRRRSCLLRLAAETAGKESGGDDPWGVWNNMGNQRKAWFHAGLRGLTFSPQPVSACHGALRPAWFQVLMASGCALYLTHPQRKLIEQKTEWGGTRTSLRIDCCCNLYTGLLLCYEVGKNHEYLIEVFSALHSKCPDAVLLLFGDGELYKKIQDKVKKMNLEDSVRFMGTTDDLHQLKKA